jgi:hypothetical protein
MPGKTNNKKTPYKQTTGTVHLTTYPEYKPSTEEEFVKQTLEIEQYLNNDVAQRLFQKYRVAFRVHLKGE